MGAFWEGRGLQSTVPVSKNNDLGILERHLPDVPDSTEAVSATAAWTPPPRAPGARMAVVNQLSQITTPSSVALHKE